MLWKIINIAALLGALILTGCVAQPHFIVKVDSLARPDADMKKTYVILPGAEGLAAGDLQFQEFAGYVDKVLLSRGLFKARNIGEADLAIFLSYGIGKNGDVAN